MISSKQEFHPRSRISCDHCRRSKVNCSFKGPKPCVRYRGRDLPCKRSQPKPVGLPAQKIKPKPAASGDMSSPEQFKSSTAENLCVYGVSNLSEQASSGEPLQRPNSPLPSPHSEASSDPSQSASTATVFQPPRPPVADVDIHRSDAAAPTPAVTSGSASSSEAAAAVSAARHAGTLTCTCSVAIACAVRDPEPGIPAAGEETMESLLQLSNDELQVVDGFLACPYPHEAFLDVLVYMLLHRISNALEKAVQKEAADAARRREIVLGAQNIL